MLDKVGVVHLTHLFSVAWRSGAVPLDLKITHLKKKNVFNLEFRNYESFTQGMEQWMS